MPELTDEQKEHLYVAWRFSMYVTGYGSYDKIDRDVEEEKLCPVIASLFWKSSEQHDSH